MFRCRAYLVLMFSFLSTGTCFQIISSNLNLYLRHSIGIPEQFQNVLAVTMGSAFIFIGIFVLLLRFVSCTIHSSSPLTVC